MSKTGGVMKTVGNVLRSLGIKAPWKYTGPASSPEYLSHLPKAVDYRSTSPVSQRLRPIIPQGTPEYVYDIKYYTRDSRRSGLSGGSMKMEKSEVDPKAENAAASGPPPTPGKPFRYTGKLRDILDNDNNGYTI